MSWIAKQETNDRRFAKSNKSKGASKKLKPLQKEKYKTLRFND